MATAFGTLLYQKISERDLTAEGFAELVSYTKGALSKVHTGKLKPPLHLIDAWATALRLDAQESREFRELAHLEHAPHEVRALVVRLRGKVLSYQQKEIDNAAELVQSKAKLSLLIEHLRRKGVGLPKGAEDV